jgi:aminopeptidase
MSNLVSIAAGHIRDILAGAIKRAPSERVVVIYDLQSGLSKIMADAYREAIPDGQFIDFAETDATSILKLIDELSPGDVFVLVQSNSFRLNEFRIRIELFKRKLKCIEHVHLDRMSEDQYATWVDALAFDQQYLRTKGHALKAVLDQASTVKIIGKDSELVWEGGMEEAKLNIGDYTGMENIGGTYPIGEVFTEARDLSKVNGSFRIYAFAGDDFNVRFFEPFLVSVVDGILIPGEDAPEEFKKIMDLIRAEERVLVRELGVGMNRAISRKTPVNDITAFERVLGLHMSIGEKHGVYKKPGLIPTKTRYHVDVFPAFERLEIDGKVVFDNTLAENQILV